MSSLTHPPTRSIKRGHSKKHKPHRRKKNNQIYFTNWILLTYIFSIGLVPLFYYHYKAIVFKHRLKKLKKIPMKPLNSLMLLFLIPLLTSFVTVIYYGIRANEYHYQLKQYYSRKKH